MAVNRLLDFAKLPPETFKVDREDMAAKLINQMQTDSVPQNQITGKQFNDNRQDNPILSKLTELAKDPSTYSALASIGSVVAAAEGEDTMASALSNISSRIDENVRSKAERQSTLAAEKFKEEEETRRKKLQIQADKDEELKTIQNERDEALRAQKKQDRQTEITLIQKGYKKISDPLETENIPDRFLIKVPLSGDKSIDFVNEKELNARKKQVQKEVAYNKNVLKKNQNIKTNIDKLIRQNEQGTWELTDLGKYLAVNPVLQRSYRAGGFKPQRDADAAKDFIISNLTLDRLQQIRENSPTGGSLGNVSDKDIQLLKSAALALREGQSEEAIAQALGSLSVELDKLNAKAIIDPRQLLFSDPFKKETVQTGSTQTGQTWERD
jgi:hypothetical protein